MVTLTNIGRVLGLIGLAAAAACSCYDADYALCERCEDESKTAYECHYTARDYWIDSYGNEVHTDWSFRLSGCYADLAEIEDACIEACNKYGDECVSYHADVFYCDGVDDCDPNSGSASATAGASGPSCGDWAPASSITANPAAPGYVIEWTFFAGLLSDVNLVHCDSTLLLPNVTSPGFTLANIEVGSLADSLGLEDGDVLVSINRQPLSTSDELIDAVLGLSSTSSFSLEISREGRSITLSYTVR